MIADSPDAFAFGANIGRQLNLDLAEFLKKVQALLDQLDDVPMDDLERKTTRIECTRMVAQHLRNMGDAFDRQIDQALYGEPPDETPDVSGP